MKYYVSSSFGKDSMATALVALEKGLPIDGIVYCEVMFDNNTSGEVPEHRDFIYEKAIPFFENRGIKTNVIRAETSFSELFRRVIGGNSERAGRIWSWPLCGRCYVQRDLKISPLHKWKKENIGADAKYYVGIAADEDSRIDRLDPADKISILNQNGIREIDTYEICNRYGLLSPVYDFSCRNGCFFCSNAKYRELRHLYEHHKDLWDRMLALQALPNKATEYFTRDLRFCDIDQLFRLEDAQYSLFGGRVQPFDESRILDFRRK